MKRYTEAELLEFEKRNGSRTVCELTDYIRRTVGTVEIPQFAPLDAVTKAIRRNLHAPSSEGGRQGETPPAKPSPEEPALSCGEEGALTRAEVNRKAWATRRTNEERMVPDPAAPRIAQTSHAYPSNDRIDEAIKEAYHRFREHNNRQAIASLAQRIGWPRHQVNRRARALGLSQTKEAYWHEAEEAIVVCWGHLTDLGLQKKLKEVGFHRTLTAVHLKVKRLRIRQNLDGYSANQLAEAFGVDSHKIGNWIKRGCLLAERRGTQRLAVQGGDEWWIRRSDVRAFIMRYPAEIDLAKVEKFWFLDVITNGEICS